MVTDARTGLNVTPDLLDYRYEVLMTDIEPIADGLHETTSKLFDRLDRAIEEIAARMVGEVIQDSERTRLEKLRERIHADVRSEVIQWALDVEEARAAAKATAA